MSSAATARLGVPRLLRQSYASFRNTRILGMVSPISSLRFFSSERVAPGMDIIGDHCDLHLVQSPYPPISSGPFPPIAEFVTSEWASNGGSLRLDKVAILDGTTGLTRTFGDYQSVMQHVSAALRYEYNIHENSTVALFSPNHVDYLPVSLAVSLCGAKLTPINPLNTARELEIILQRSKTSMVITHGSKLETVLTAVKNCPTVKNIVVLTDDENDPVPVGTVSVASLKQHDLSHTMKETIHNIHNKIESHPYLLPYSSGTTGLPKGVCLTHRNLVVNLMQVAGVEDMGFPMDHKLISPLPFYHIYGFLMSLLYCAWKGQQVITMSGRFDLEVFCKLVQEHQPERAHLVPPIIVGLAKHPIVDKYDFGSLQQIVSAAAPLGSHVELVAKERLSCEIKQAWGMSELSPMGLINSDFNSKIGSVGPLAPSTYGKIVDEHGNSQAAHKVGELLIKGPQVMLGYLDDVERTAECLSDSGWLRTGDVAYFDDEGYFFITDRLKELIKVRGYQVAPAELEALLLTHDHIQDAAVISVPDEDSGELPRAYVVLQTDEVSQSISEDDIKTWVKGNVAPYKRLDGGVIFIDKIPKSASGKILRRVLRDEVAAELAVKQ